MKNSKSNHKPEAKASFPGERIRSHPPLGEHGEPIIEHDGREYRLRLTQNGKLILTA
jgi:hemin uptake protein HemP